MIGELFDFAQNQYFTERARHRIENEPNGLDFSLAYQRRLRSVFVRRYIGDELFGITLAVVINLQTRFSPPVRQPTVIAISYNREDPGADITAAISSEASIGSKECLLHNILGRVGIPAEKTREIVRRIELRNDILLKSSKGGIRARRPALHQQTQLIQCGRWSQFDGPASRRRGGRFSSRLHEVVHKLHARPPTSCRAAHETAALQLRRAAKDGIGSFLWRATLQTCGLCDWKCIFLQWIAGSIFLKCEYPEKHNKINDLHTAILC
jgi:hypothetical protein